MTPEFKSTATTVADPSIFTGTCYMDLLNPNPAEIHLADIARALSRIARFNGMTTAFYSVAEHCVNCLALARRDPLGGTALFRAVLMHDAAEAYLGDVTSPLKAHLPDYRAIERRMEAAVAERFGLSPVFTDWVKRFDMAMLAAEQRDLMKGSGRWPLLDGVEVPDIHLLCMSPHYAERSFLAAARELGLE